MAEDKLPDNTDENDDPKFVKGSVNKIGSLVNKQVEVKPSPPDSSESSSPSDKSKNEGATPSTDSDPTTGEEDSDAK